MKRGVLTLLMIGLIGFSACDDSGLPLPENCIEVRLVAELCGQGVLEVVSREHFDLGEKSWKNHEGEEFNNVFSTRFDCEDMRNVPQDGSTFLIKLVDEYEPQQCATCFALLGGAPETFHLVKMIDECQPLELGF